MTGPAIQADAGSLPARLSFQIDALDGLRGLAVLVVFVSHCSIAGMPLVPGLDFSGIGKSGVFLFFMLSAFLLTYQFVATGREAFRRVFLESFFLRRFLRIYPLYVVYLLIGLATTSALAHLGAAAHAVPFELSGREFLKHLALLEGKDVTWSIPVEFKYYLILPAVAFLHVIVLGRRAWPALLASAGLVFVAQWVWPPEQAASNDVRVGPYLPIFLLGSLAAVAHHRWQLAGQSARKLLEFVGWSSLLVLAAMTPALASAVTGSTVPLYAFHKMFVLQGILWTCVLLATIDGAGGLRWIFEGRWLRYFGRISFSFYLIHYPVILLFSRFVPPLAANGWLVLILVMAASHLSYVGIEKPASKVRLRPSAAGAT